MRVWIDGTLQIDDWTRHAATLDQKALRFDAGSEHAIRIEYFDGGVSATMKLEWQPPGATALVAIPSAALATVSQQSTAADRAAIPVKVDVQPVSSTSAIVAWTNLAPDATGFVVERSQGASGAWSVVGGTLAAGARSLRDDALVASTAYHYRVSALRAAGKALPSAVADATMPTASSNAIFFVATDGNDANAGTEKQPWATLQHATGKLTPGQTVLVRKGDYVSGSYVVLNIETSGTPTGWITYKAYPGETPRIVSQANNWYGVQVLNAAYIRIDGFEFKGNLANVTPDDVQADVRANKPRTSGSAISINGRDGTGVPAHHVVVRNNDVHDFPGGGISAIQSDWVTIQDNVVDSTAWYSSYGGSGISVLTPRDVDDDTTDYKYVIERNISTRNRNDVPCKCDDYKAVTDGNGIIMDTFKQYAYKGRTVIQNNVVHANGGRGIHVFQSSNVDVRFNTTYQNARTPVITAGDLTAIDSSNVRFYDNIASSLPNRPSNTVSGSTNVTFDFNLAFGGTGFNTTGAAGNLVGVDPRFADPAHGDFTLATAGVHSPAIDASGGPLGPTAHDQLYRPRVSGRAADLGALEAVQ